MSLKVTKNQAHTQLKGKPSVSVVVTTYNDAATFKLVFASLEKQSHKNFEVLICDDGSNEENVKLLKELIQSTALPCQHLWHEDKGFRKSIILNHGIVNSASSYIVFLDGDCVIHPDFVSDHYNNRKLKTVLAGRRVELSPLITSLMTVGKIKSNYIENNKLWLFPLILHRSHSDIHRGFRIQNEKIRSFFNKKERGILGCNFSLHKEDLLTINGFDMRYIGSGLEESDLDFRLKLSGVKIKSFCNLGVQYHLYHQTRKRVSQNMDLYNQVLIEKKMFTEFGISSL